jgi:hypothetical protein
MANAAGVAEHTKLVRALKREISDDPGVDPTRGRRTHKAREGTETCPNPNTESRLA